MTDQYESQIAAKLAQLEQQNAYEHYRPLRDAAGCFVSMVQVETNDCIIWPGGRSSSGYGVLNVKEQGKRVAKNVHVLACERHHGPRPEGAQVAHSCGVKTCFNPKHVRWASRSENEADKLGHGRSNRGDQRIHKLNPASVGAIRILAAEGMKHHKIAGMFGISRQHVGDIANGRRWEWM